MFAPVSVSVCLFAFQQDYSKTTDQIFNKIDGEALKEFDKCIWLISLTYIKREQTGLCVVVY